MGVYIKDMEMPKRCLHCPLVRDGYFPPKCAFPRRRKVTEDDTPRSNPACYLTEDQDEDDMIKISEDEFRVYSRALLIVLEIRDALSDLKQFVGEDEPKNITSEGKT